MDSVILRSRQRPNGKKLLYLAITYNGSRRYEYLGLYLIPELSRKDKIENKETIALAEAIKAKRITEMTTGKFGFEDKNKGKVMLFDWFEKQKKEYEKKGSDKIVSTTKNVIRQLKLYTKNKDIKISSIDKKFVLGFIDHLNNVNKKYDDVQSSPREEPIGHSKLSKETVYTYYIMFSIIMNRAVKKELIKANPCNLIDSEDKPERRTKAIVYLTLEEVHKLIDTECGDWKTKYAFLFCCFTGLRWIDVSYLKWGDIKEIDEKKQIEIIQKKTKAPVYIPLSENALKWLPEKGINGWGNYIFPFTDRSMVYDYLHKWVDAAGIDKKIVFHTSRHTYATLLLYYGADIYTVSKLLGHASVKSTQRYAEVMNDTKRKAVDNIPTI